MCGVHHYLNATSNYGAHVARNGKKDQSVPSRQEPIPILSGVDRQNGNEVQMAPTGEPGSMVLDTTVGVLKQAGGRYQLVLSSSTLSNTLT
jgi:hypothetical protein